VCVIGAFVACCAYFGATQPVTAGEGAGGEGQALHAMAKALPRELPSDAAAPYSSRIGLPLMVSIVAKSLDWVIAGGFDRLNFFFNLASVILLTVLLQAHVKISLFRIALVLMFLIEPHSPVRLSYAHPISTDAVTMALMLAGLVGIHWFERRPTSARAAAVAGLVSVGVLVHEALLLIAVCTLFARMGTDGWRARFTAMNRSGAWLPIVAAGLTLLAVKLWQPGTFFLAASTDLLALTIPRYLLAWFLVFGVLLLLPTLRWRGSLRYLRDRPALLVFAAGCVVGTWGGDHPERTIALATPVMLIIAGRALTSVARSPVPSVAFAMHAASSRVLVPIGGPIATPEVVGEVWERLISARLSWALSYANMWSRLCAAPMLAVYAAWYAFAGAITLFVVPRLDRRPAPSGSPPPSAPRSASAFTSRMFVVVLGTVALMAPVVWLATSGVYQRYYAESSAIYLPYNVARVVLLLVIMLVCWGVGSRAIRIRDGDAEPGVVDALFCGAALWSLAVVVLAALHLYNQPLLIALVAVATAVAVHDLLARRWQPGRFSDWSLPTLLAGSVAVVHLVAILIGIVLWGHFGGDNDVPGSYLPYYQTVLDSGSIAPNHYWVHFFATKGNGLGLLANALSDVQGSGLATLAVILMGGALLVRLGLRTGVPLAASLIALCLYLQFFGSQGAYAKAHIIRNLLIGYLVVSASEALWSGARAPFGTVARVAVIVAVIVLSPLAIVILAPVLIVPAAIFLLSNRLPWRRLLIEPAWAAAAVVVVLAYNYVQVGLLELHSMPSLAGRFVDVNRLSQWIDPALAFLDYRLAFVQAMLPGGLAAESALAIAPTESVRQVVEFLLPAGTPVLLGAVFVGAAFAIPFARPEGRNASLALLNLAIAVGVLIVLRMFGGGPGSSMGRFTDFATPLVLSATLIAFVASWTHLQTIASKSMLGLVTAVAAVVAIRAGFEPVRALPWRESASFAFGGSSYAAMNELSWGTSTATALARTTPPDARIELLGFLPGFTAVPGAKFERPDGSSYVRDYSKVLFAAEDEAAKRYTDNNINYFVFDVSPSTPIVWSGFAPLFSPESVRTRMQVVMHHASGGRDVYLATWRAADSAADDQVEQLASRWGAKLEIEKASGPYYGAYAFAARQLSSR